MGDFSRIERTRTMVEFELLFFLQNSRVQNYVTHMYFKDYVYGVTYLLTFFHMDTLNTGSTTCSVENHPLPPLCEWWEIVLLKNTSRHSEKHNMTL